MFGSNGVMDKHRNKRRKAAEGYYKQLKSTYLTFTITSFFTTDNSKSAGLKPNVW